MGEFHLPLLYQLSGLIKLLRTHNLVQWITSEDGDWLEVSPFIYPNELIGRGRKVCEFSVHLPH
jgi:hypothetical protein